MATTPNMGLTIGVPGATAGPTWAEGIEDNNELLDAHDHSSTKGARVPAAGLNINGELDFNDNGTNSMRVVGLSSIAAPSDRSVLYQDTSGDLHWIDPDGNNVRITDGSALYNAVAYSDTYTVETVSASPYTVSGTTKSLIRVDTTAGARQINLPAASSFSAGKHFVLLDIGNGANAISVVPSGTDKINGHNQTYTIQIKYGRADLVDLDGTDDWSLSSPLNGTINDSAVNAGNVLTRTNATAHTYVFSALNLAGGSDCVSGRLPSANMTQATTGAEGIVQLTQDLAGTSTAPTVVALTGSGGTATVRCSNLEFATGTTPKLRVAASAGVGQTLEIIGQAAGGSNQNGGSVTLSGGAPSGIGQYGSIALFADTLALTVTKADTGGRGVVGLISQPSTLKVPGGDGVVYVGNATTAPSTNPATEVPTAGFVMYSAGGYPAFKDAGGQTTSFGMITAGAFVRDNWTARMNVTINGTTYTIPLYT